MPVAAFAERARVARGQRRASRFRIGMVARLEAHKDQPTLIRAAGLLGRRGLDCEVWLIGEGSRRRELETLIAAEDLRDRVRLLGMRRDVPELVGQLDLFVFATTPDEGLGIALIEAMAAGVPVVASDVGACREVLDDGALGLLVPPRDPVALADAILRVRDEPAAAAARAERARRKAFEAFDASAWLRPTPRCSVCSRPARLPRCRRPEPMRPTVVHVLSGLGLGGNETLCLQIVRHAPPGVANVVIYQDPARTELLPLFEGVPGLRLRCVPTHGRLRLVGAWLLAKEIRRLRPVAVLIYAFGLHHLLMAAAARLAGVRFRARQRRRSGPARPSRAPSMASVLWLSSALGVPVRSCSAAVERSLGSWAALFRAAPAPSPMAATSPGSPTVRPAPAGFAGATGAWWLAWSPGSTRSRTRRP